MNVPCPDNFDPPHLDMVKLAFAVIHVIFLISDLKYKVGLHVLVKRRF